MSEDDDRTASLMTPARLAQLKVHPKPAASPAAWLDQMAADAGSGHVRRLLELRGQLAAQMREDGAQALAGPAAALLVALGDLDFALVQPKGRLARAIGKGKEAAAGFLAQAQGTLRAGEDLVDETRSLQRTAPSQGAAVERGMLEMEVEIRALEKIMDQGARWLQDMRNQLKTRQAQGGDEAVQEQIRQDTARCELLVVRLKQLRAALTPAQQALEGSKGLASRRTEILASAQQILEGAWPRWQKKFAKLTEQVAQDGSASAGLDGVRTAQQELHAGLQELLQGCGAARAQQQAVAEALVLAEPLLQAAA